MVATEFQTTFAIESWIKLPTNAGSMELIHFFTMESSQAELGINSKLVSMFKLAQRKEHYILQEFIFRMLLLVLIQKIIFQPTWFS